MAQGNGGNGADLEAREIISKRGALYLSIGVVVLLMGFSVGGTLFLADIRSLARDALSQATQGTTALTELRGDTKTISQKLTEVSLKVSNIDGSIGQNTERITRLEAAVDRLSTETRDEFRRVWEAVRPR